MTVPPNLSGFPRDKRGAALAEYVLLLLLIAAASLGTFVKFGDEIRSVFDDTAAVLGGETTGDGTGGSGGSGSYDPGGGYVVAGDVAAGCMLPVGAEYFSDTHTVELDRWAWTFLPPADPENPPARIGPYPDFAGGTHVILPSDGVWELYQQKGERFAFTRNFYWYHTGQFSPAGNTPGSYSYCSDRSKDGPRPPADSPAGPGTSSIIASGAFEGASSTPTLGFFDQDGDIDWHRLDVTGGAVRATIEPAFVKGRLPLKGDLSLKLVDETGAVPTGVTSSGNAVMASSLPIGTYYLAAENHGSSYGGMGGYEIKAGTIEDTPETMDNARDLSLGDVWQEDLPEADAGDMFRIVLPEDREVDIVVRARGIGDTPVGSLTLRVLSRDSSGAVKTLKSANDDDERFLLNHLSAGDTEYFAYVGYYYGNHGDYLLTVEEVDDAAPAPERAMELPLNEVLVTSRFDPEDTDFYILNNPAAQQILLSIDSGGSFYGQLELFDAEMTSLGISDRDTYSLIVFDELPAGRYFLKADVPEYINLNSWGDYALLAEVLEGDTPGALELARPLEFGKTHSEDIAFITDLDAFSFTVPVTQDVLLAASGASRDIMMRLYDHTGAELKNYRPTDKQTQARILVNDLEAGTYLVSLNSHGDYTTDYMLSVGPVADTPAAFERARPLALGDRYAEEISTVDDADMFVFENDMAQQIKIGASATRRFRARLYDADRNLLVDHGSSTLNKSFTTNVLEPGTYYILMSSHMGYTTDYDLYARPN